MNLLFQSISEHAWGFSVEQNTLWSSSTSALIWLLHGCKKTFTPVGRETEEPGSWELQESIWADEVYGQALQLAVIWQGVAKAGNEAGLWDTDSKKSENELKCRDPPVCHPKALCESIAWAGMETNMWEQCVTSEQRVVSQTEAKAEAVDGKIDLLNVC